MAVKYKIRRPMNKTRASQLVLIGVAILQLTFSVIYILKSDYTSAGVFGLCGITTLIIGLKN